MTPRKLFSLIVILAFFALSGCGSDGSDGGGGGDTAPPAQPVRANVFIAFDQTVTNLAGLECNLNSAPGATFDNATQQIAAINAAQGSSVVANFDAATNSAKIILVNGGAAGINTGTSPIIRITYNVAAGSGVPTFGIASQATFTAISDINGTPTTPAVTAANVVVTVTYE